MEQPDVKAVLKIIRDYNPDDYAPARASYKQGLYNQYVLTQGSAVIGMTGGRPVHGTDRSF